MNLLLLLSALLSAISGAIGGVRLPQARVEQVAVRAVRAVRPVAQRARSWLALAAPPRMAPAPAPDTILFRAIPLFLSKRRE